MFTCGNKHEKKSTLDLPKHVEKFFPTSATSVGLCGDEMEKKGKQVGGR